MLLKINPKTISFDSFISLIKNVFLLQKQYILKKKKENQNTHLSRSNH